MAQLLSDAQVRMLATGAVLLADFDRAISRDAAETIADACRLYLVHGRAARVAAASWPAIQHATAVMTDAERGGRPAPSRSSGSIAFVMADVVRRHAHEHGAAA